MAPVRQPGPEDSSETPLSLRWTLTGALGGAALGLTVGGPIGAVVGIVAGAAGGQLRDSTGRSAFDHFENLPAEERARLLRQAAQTAGMQASSSDSHTLSRAELQAIPSSRAPSDAVACKVCMDRLVTVSLRPCGHACTCAPCLLQLMDRHASSAGAPHCPVCRCAIEGSHRVFL